MNWHTGGKMEEKTYYFEEEPKPEVRGEPVKIIGVGEWLWTMFLMWIPLINLIVLIIWSFDSSTNKIKSNWAKAQLIVLIVGSILSTSFWIFFSAVIYELAIGNY